MSFSVCFMNSSCKSLTHHRVRIPKSLHDVHNDSIVLLPPRLPRTVVYMLCCISYFINNTIIQCSPRFHGKSRISSNFLHRSHSNKVLSLQINSNLTQTQAIIINTVAIERLPLLSANFKATDAKSAPMASTFRAARAQASFSTTGAGCHLGGPALVSSPIESVDALISDIRFDAKYGMYSISESSISVL
jgi:hypothetical protein